MARNRKLGVFIFIFLERSSKIEIVVVALFAGFMKLSIQTDRLKLLHIFGELGGEGANLYMAGWIE